MGDFNGDGSQDLVVAFHAGEVVCHYNDAFGKPLLRVRLGRDVRGPIQFSLWQGEKSNACLGTFVVTGPACRVPLRDTRDCALRYRLPGGERRSRTIRVPKTLPAGGIDVLLER